MLSPGQRWIRKWGRKALFIALTASVLIALTIWLGPKAWDEVKAFRARKLVDFADVQKQAGNLPEMKSFLLQAYGLAPNEEKVLRAMAADYAGNPAEAVQFLQQLATRSDASREDKLLFYRKALDANLAFFGRQEFEKLLLDPDAKKDPVLAELSARYLVSQGEAARALEWANDTGSDKTDATENTASKPAFPPPSSTAQLNLIRAKLLLDAVRPDSTALDKTAEEVVAVLQAAKEKGEPTERREATLLLARLYVTAPPVRNVISVSGATQLLKDLAEWLDEPTWETRLNATDLEIALRPDDKANIVAKLAKNADEASENQRLSLARWCNSRKENAIARKLAEAPEGNSANREWFLIRMDAMAAQNQWAEIQDILLEEKGIPIEEVLARTYLWRCARELKLPSATISQRAEDIARVCRSAPPAEALHVANYTETLRDYETAATIYRDLVSYEATAGAAFTGLVRCIGQDPRNTSGLRDVLEQFLSKFPGVKEAKNDLAYIDLLEGRKLQDSIQVASTLVQESPHILAYRTTLALSQLISGNVVEAKKIYTGVIVDWNTVPAGWRSVYVAVLGANGEIDEATTLSKSLQWSALREGEQRLLQKHLPSFTQTNKQVSSKQ